MLFIGNSFTSTTGVATQLTGLSPSCTTASFDEGGSTLEQHWNDAPELRSVATGHWNYVVLQDQSQSPVINPPSFAATPRSSIGHRSSGAKRCCS